MTRAHALLGCALLFAAACATVPSAEELNTSMNLAAEDYIRLVLAVGEHDADYVDAYYGPAELREEVRAEKLSLASIRDRARLLHNTLRALPQPSEELSRLRHQYLLRQVESLQGPGWKCFGREVQLRR